MTLDIGHWIMDFRFWALAMVCFLSTCQTKQTETATLSDEKIAQIMADLSVAEAATTGLAGYQKDSLMHIYFKQVFEIQGVSLELYEKELRILAQDLTHMERVVKQADELLTDKAPGN